MGHFWRLMTARLNRKRKDDTRPASDGHRVNYNKAGFEEDPFQHPSMREPTDENQHDVICKAVANIKNGQAESPDGHIRVQPQGYTARPRGNLP